MNPLTLGEVLELDVFRAAGARLVAGAAGLGRAVRWAHPAEVPDIAGLLRGGELLLTTGVMFPGSTASLHRYVAELDAAGAAGLMIELVRRYREPPAALVQEADHRGFPVIVIDRETPFVELTERLHREILARQYRLQQELASVAQGFDELVLQGASVRLILQHLAEVARATAVLEDAAHVVVDHAGELPTPWEAHSRSDQAHGADGSCRRTDIVIRGELWARLHCISPGAGVDLVRVAIERARAAIGLTMLTDRHAAQVVDQARGALVNDLLQRRVVTAAELRRRAAAVGAGLEGRALLGLAIEPPGLAEIASRNRLSELDRHELRLSVLAEVEAALRAWRLVLLPALVGDQVLAVVGLPAGRRSARDLLGSAVAEAANRTLTRFDLALAAGAGRVADPAGLAGSLREAGEALRVSLRAPGGGLTMYDELGAQRLLLRLAEGPDLTSYVESELGAILRHDAGSAHRLLPTLRELVRARGNKVAAASALGIERRTLYNRLERIERLLGRSLDDHVTWTGVTLAVEGLDLIQVHR